MKFRLFTLPAIALMAMSSSPLSAQTFTDLAVSWHSVCALMDSGEVHCSGRDSEESPERYVPTSNLPLMTAISSGEQHSCGIDLSGMAVCWGGGVGEDLKSEYPFGYFDQLNVPAIDQPLVSIASGAYHSCAIDVNNKAWCWGLNANGQTEPPNDGMGSAGEGYIKLDAGGNFTCGIQVNGRAECWSTDISMTRAGVVAGPFVDLDVLRNNACGLKEDGTIECWIRRTSIPNNGPYTDLVVSNSGVCGLTLNQQLDCNGTDFFNKALPVFSNDLTFTKIESASRFYSYNFPFCGITTEGNVECSSSFNGIELPGQMLMFENELSDLNLPFTAKRYSKNQIELLWPSQQIRYGLEALRFEIYRNDVLVDTTVNSSSWYDDSVQTNNPISYKIRAVNLRGSVGPFSATAIVDNDNGRVTFGEGANTEFDVVTPSHTVDSVATVVLADQRYITWSGSTPGMNGLKGYEVRVNNDVISYNDGFSIEFPDYDRFTCFLISVAAMSFDDKIIDYRTIVVNRKASNYSCKTYY